MLAQAFPILNIDVIAAMLDDHQQKNSNGFLVNMAARVEGLTEKPLGTARLLSSKGTGN